MGGASGRERFSPRIIAHRGSSAHATENTLAAFELACEQGADAIELDVQLCADGVPVIFHDTTLRRLTRERGSLMHRDAAALARLRVHPNGRPSWRQPIPTLEQVLRRFAGRIGLLVELKVPRHETRGEALARAVIQALRRHGDLGRTWLLGFHRPTMLAARRLSPAALPCALSLPRLPGSRALARHLAPFEGLVCPARAVRPPQAAAQHSAGRQVFAYRCDSPPMTIRALRAGVDGLMADDPARLRARVAAFDARP